MNPTITQMTHRSTVRKLDPSREIPKDILENILRATQQSPTYTSGQQYSIIVVDDKVKKEKIADQTISSAGVRMEFIHEAPIFLLFIMDFNKIDQALAYENANPEIFNTIENILIGTVDVGIAAEAATVAAESYGLGTVMVGALRKSTETLIKDFNLPKYCIPLLGLAIGYPSKEMVQYPDPSYKVTPRFPLEYLVHYNNYEKKDLKKHFEDYNIIMKEHFLRKRGLDSTWTAYMTRYYSKPFNKELLTIYQKQGFNF